MNPRRSNLQIPISTDNNNSNTVFQTQSSSTTTTTLVVVVYCWVKSFLKKPHAFPFLLSLFVLLTWLSLRLHRNSFDISSPKHRLNHHHHHNFRFNNNNNNKHNNVVVEEDDDDDDGKANVMRFPSSHVLSPITKDHRGWLLDPISLALPSAFPGGARICASLHVGEIRPGGLRGNHRHHTCNETFLIWGAKTKFRLENNAVDKGYAEVIVGADEVAVAVSPSGTAHALINLDTVQTTFFLGCQDSIINYNSTTSDFNVWKDL